MNKRIIILRGTQNSGKSTVAKLFGENSIICCADDYFTDNWGNYNFDPNLLGVAHRICREKFINALDDPDIDTIVVANTNATQKDFQFYIDSAEQHGNMVFSLVVERRHNNLNNHNVPPEAIDRCEQNIKNSLKLK